MRTLKKILALVLALVMSLSLMATAGAASFQDVTDDNPYKTAIDVLTELKVVKGYGDGNFQPNGQLTRAEAAVLVYRIATGDVEDKYLDNYTFMQQSKFTDLEGYNWAKGYINYCQNAGIVVGTDATHFNPGGKVTGYQLLVMLLRTLGYGKAGEFADPKGWELQTAAIAEREKITKNVTTGDFGAPAPRAMVAELLFRGLLTETVTYSALTSGGYTKGETLGKRELGLEEIEGVVMANEYASLTSTKTARDGKTEMLVDGKTYTLDTVTNLDDIGENRLAYVQNGSKVLYLADEGNTTEESTDKEKVSDILSRAGIRSGGEKYLNFDKVFSRDCAYKLKYVLKVEGGKIGGMTPSAVYNEINAVKGSGVSLDVKPAGAVDADGNIDFTKVTEIEVTIPPRKTISSVDMKWMENIFAKADLTAEGSKNMVNGEIYVGTQSTNDISDVKPGQNYSWESFKDEYIEEKENDAGYTANENGNWVKVIDNDGDGEAEYILKVVYTMAQVSKVKDEKATLDTTDHRLVDGISCPNDSMNTLTTQSVVSADTLEKGDVVYYAIIDGKAQTYKSEVVTATIEKVDHNKLIATITDGNVEYKQSGVCEHIEDEAYESGVRNLAGKVKYDLFLDRGGHLAAFVKSDLVGDFKLLTDGWYNRQKLDEEYAVKVYNDETGKQDIVDITANGKLFVGNWGNIVLNNNWNALKGLGGANMVLNYSAVNDQIQTTVAAITEDGTILPVENSSVTGRYQHSMLDLMIEVDGELQVKVPTKDSIKGTIYSTTNGARDAYDLKGDPDVDSDVFGNPRQDTFNIRALDNTVYYVVYPSGNDAVVVRSVGYKNAPDVASFYKKGYVEDIYAVGTLHEPDNDKNGLDRYYTADVVVVELNNYDEGYEVVLVVDDTARFSDVRYRDAQIINSKGEVENVKVDWSRSTTLSYTDGKDRGKQITPGFYKLYGDKTDVCTLVWMDHDAIRDYGKIAVGQVSEKTWLAGNRYVEIENWNYNKTGDSINATDTRSSFDLTDETPLYTLAYNQSLYRSSTPSLEKDDRDVVLKGRVNETEDLDLYRESGKTVNHNWTRYNYNDVLVFHDKAGNAVYAVSFENIYKDGKPADYVEDYAQSLWFDIVPSSAKATTVDFGSFYGVNFGLKDGVPCVGTTTGAGTAVTAELDYQDAKDTADCLSFNAKYSTSAKVNGTIPAELPTTGMGPITVTVVDNDKAYTFTLSVKEASDDNKLDPVPGYIDAITGTTSPFTFTQGSFKGVIRDFVNAVEAGNTHLKTNNAHIDWMFFEGTDDNWTVIPKGDRWNTVHVTSDQLQAIVIAIKAENGDVAYYTSGPIGKVIVVDGSDPNVTLPDGTDKVEVAKNEDGTYTVTVRAAKGVTPVIVIGDKVYQMELAGVPATLALDETNSILWERKFTEAELEGVSVIYVRAIVGGDKNEDKWVPIEEPAPSTDASFKVSADNKQVSVDEDAKTITVVKAEPAATVEDLIKWNTNKTATVKVYDGETEVTTGELKDGYTVKVTAEDGTTTSEPYTIKIEETLPEPAKTYTLTVKYGAESKAYDKGTLAEDKKSVSWVIDIPASYKLPEAMPEGLKASEPAEGKATITYTSATEITEDVKVELTLAAVEVDTVEAAKENATKHINDTLAKYEKDETLTLAQQNAIKAAAEDALYNLEYDNTVEAVTDTVNAFDKAVADALDTTGVTVDGDAITVKYWLDASKGQTTYTAKMLQDQLNEKEPNKYTVSGDVTATSTGVTAKATSTDAEGKITIYSVTATQQFRVTIDGVEAGRWDKAAGAGTATVNNVPNGSYIKAGDTPVASALYGGSAVSDNTLTVQSDDAGADLALVNAVQVTLTGTKLVVDGIVKAAFTKDGTKTNVATTNYVQKGAVLFVNSITVEENNWWALTVTENKGVEGKAKVVENINGFNKNNPVRSYIVGTAPIAIDYIEGYKVKVGEVDLGVHETSETAIDNLTQELTAGNYVPVTATEASIADADKAVIGNGTTEGTKKVTVTSNTWGKVNAATGILQLEPAVMVTLSSLDSGYEVKYNRGFENPADITVGSTSVEIWLAEGSTILVEESSADTVGEGNTIGVAIDYTDEAKTDVVVKATETTAQDVEERSFSYEIAKGVDATYTVGKIEKVAAIDLSGKIGIDLKADADPALGVAEDLGTDVGSYKISLTTPTYTGLPVFTAGTVNADDDCTLVITATAAEGKFFASNLAIANITVDENITVTKVEPSESGNTVEITLTFTVVNTTV